MVGVGGRSKACDNCKRRHLKCDLARPECGQCTKKGIQCGGPGDIAIIPYNSRRRAAPSSEKQCDDASSLHIGSQLMKEDSSNHTFNSISNLPISYDDLFMEFTHLNLLPGTEKIDVVPGVDRAITAQCFLALSCTYFGVKHQDKRITQRGLLRYSRALTTVNNALTKYDAVQSFDLLEAVTIMAMIEFLISERENGWINHARGLERIFDLRGSEKMTSLPCLMILEKTRPSIIFAAMVLRQPTILARQNWKTDPWLLHPERIDAMKLLVDIISDCPELFVLRNHMLTDPDDAVRENAARNLFTKCSCVLKNLEQWEDNWVASIAHACIEIPSPPTTPVLRGEDGRNTFIWSTVYQYDSLLTANVVTMYNAALILVLDLLQGIDPMVRGTYNDQTLQGRIYTAGMTICRSVEYHHGKLWGEQGGFFLLFPLRMAYNAVGKTDPSIGTWLRTVLDEIATGKRGLWKSAKTLLEI